MNMRLDQPAFVEHPQYKLEPLTQNPAQPGPFANDTGVIRGTAAELKPVTVSPILSVLLKQWYAGIVDLEPNSDPRVLRRVPQYVGLLPNLVLSSKLASDWHVALAAAVYVRAAARLITRTSLTTGAGPYFGNLLKDEIRMLRLAGFDPSLPPESPFDDFESTSIANDASENGLAADDVG